MKLLKQFLPELLVFGCVLAVLLIDLNPDFTFINKAADSIGYIYSAQYLYPSYHTSPPLYLTVSHFFLMLPFGTEAWRMGLLSLLSTMGACVFIYLIIRKQLSENPNVRYYALFGVLVYGLSALVISQSIIVNTYATTCMLASGVYYFAVTKHWKLMGMMIGIGLAVHLLMGFVFIIMFLGYKEYRKNWKALLITFSFVICYIYIPLTNRFPYMWLPDPEKVNTIWATITDTVSTINMLIGSLAIWDLPKRIFDIIGLVGVSIGVITVVPLIYYFRRNKTLRNPLLWLIVVPITLFAGELDMNTYDYTMLAMPFLTVAICLGLSFMQFSWVKAFRVVTVIIIVGFGMFNCFYFDIGKNLDKDLSATKLFREEFNKLPDNSIFMPNYAWEWEAIYKYTKDTGKNIYPICIDILPSEMYREQLIKDGIKLVGSNDANVSIKSSEMAKSIAELNDNVWTTVSYDTYTFGSHVVPTNKSSALVANVDRDKIKQVSENPQILWKPYNPYDIITTCIFITDWNYILFSNYNVRMFASLACAGLLINWFLWRINNKKEKLAG